MEVPECLYHYTNIETLALILKNKTIRFNSLDKMDDLQEQETADIKNIGQFCYISAWTEDERESIPMWNMYASIYSGVRIKMRRDPFKRYLNCAADIQSVTALPVIDESNGKGLPSIIPIAEMLSKGFYCNQALSNQSILFKVEYTNDLSKLYPRLLENHGAKFSISLGELGKFKNLHWQFQNEWRYILTILPLNLNQSIEYLESHFLRTANRIRMGLEKQPFPYYEMVIADEAFSQMEITLSPKISAGNRVIAQTLVNKYNPPARIKESNLLGLL